MTRRRIRNRSNSASIAQPPTSVNGDLVVLPNPNIQQTNTFDDRFKALNGSIVGKIFQRSTYKTPVLQNNNVGTPVAPSNASVAQQFTTPPVPPFSFTPVESTTRIADLDTHREYFKADNLTIARTNVTNDGYQQVSINGISAIRPELISVLNFNPIFENTDQKDASTNLTPHGSLIDINNKALILRRDNLIANIASLISNAQLDPSVLDSVRIEFEKKLTDVTSLVNYSVSIHEAIEQIKNILDFYDEINNYTIQYQKNSFALQGISNISNSNIKARTFIDRYMKFSPSQVDRFTNTKLYLQLLIDLKNALEGYSYQLFSELDPDRGPNAPAKFLDPYTLDTTYASNNNRFLLKNWVPQDGTTLIATRQVAFNNFYGLMPNRPEDRIKLLITILSKEYRVSKALGNKVIADKLASQFGAGVVGSPFDNICGIPGSTIFQSIGGDKSLASLAVVTNPNDENVVIFPFENKYIDQETNITDPSKKYIPGSSYFVDSIVDYVGIETTDTFNPVFNINPIKSFSSNAFSKLTNADLLIRSLLDVNNKTQTSELQQVPMFRSFISKIQQGTSALIYDLNASPDQAAISAILKYAYSDPVLKAMLYQYILLSGIAINSTKKDKKIFEKLAEELGSTKELPYIPVPNSTAITFNDDSNVNAYNVLLNNAAKNIEDYIINSIYKKRNRIADTAVNNYGAGASFGTNSTLMITEGSVLGSNGVESIGLDNITGIFILRGEITKILTSIAYPSTSNASYTNLISEFINLVDFFYDNAMESNATNFLIPNTAGRTRFNLLTTSGQLLMLYEVLLSMCQLFVKADFAINLDFKNELAIYIDTKSQKLINDSFKEYVLKNQDVPTLSFFDPRIISAKNISVPEAEVTSTGLRATFDFTFKPGTGRWTPRIEWNTNEPDIAIAKPRNQIAESTTSLYTQNSATSLTQQFMNLFGVNNGNLGAYTNIEQSFVEDVKTIEGMLDILSVIRTNMGSINNILLSTFTMQGVNTTKNESNALYKTSLIQFFQQFTGEFSFLRDKGQSQIALWQLNRVRNQLSNAPKVENTDIDDTLRPLFAGFTPTDKELKLLYKYLANSVFLKNNNAADRTKILSVGIPMGFAKNITERMKRSKDTSSFHSTNTTSLIKINVYKRDYRYDEIVFKPKIYQFDLNLYQDDQQFNKFDNLDTITYDNCKNFNQLIDYGNISGGKVQSYTYQSIAQSNEKYRALNEQTRKEIFANHLQSFLLERYINYTTGLNINESAFYSVSAGKAIDIIDNITNEPSIEINNFKTLIFEYVSKTMNTSIDKSRTFENVIADDSLPVEVRDFIKLTTNSIIFNPNYTYNKIMIPKMFERVFHIPITSENVEPFYIDMDATRRTQAGTLALNTQSFQQKLLQSSTGEYYIQPANSSDSIFVDFFVTIEGNDVLL